MFLSAETFDVVFDRFVDDLDCHFSAADFACDGILAFEVFVNTEEVRHFIENMLGEFGDVLIGIVGRVLKGDRDDLCSRVSPRSV